MLERLSAWAVRCACATEELFSFLLRHRRLKTQIKASDNMLTGGSVSPPLEQIAPPVTDVCPSSEKLKFGSNYALFKIIPVMLRTYHPN